MLTTRQRRFLQKVGRGTWYRLLHFYVIPFLLVERSLTWILVRNDVLGQFRHIRVTDLSRNSNPHFLQVTLDALALIEKHDPRRLRRVLKEVRFIVSEYMTSFGGYGRFQRICWMNFRSISMDWDNKDAPEYEAHYEWWVACCASTIIHEATHGRLHSLGFDYNKKSRVRIERICVAEQRRFAARIPSERYSFATDLVVPYDPARWLSSWNRTWRQRWQEVRDFLREMRADNKKKDALVKSQTADESASVPTHIGRTELPLLSQIRKRRK